MSFWSNSPKVTPDSQKSTTQKTSENASGLGDKIAGAVQPGTLSLHTLFTPPPSLVLQANTLAEGNKSMTQKAGDATRSGGDSAQEQGKGVVGSVQDSLSSAGQTVSDTLSGNKKQ